MDILPDGSWELDRGESALALNCISAAILPLDTNLAPKERIERIYDESLPIFDRIENLEKNSTLRLNSAETRILEDAVSIARDNYFLAVGMYSGIRSTLKMSHEQMESFLQTLSETSTFHEQLKVVLSTGVAALTLSGIIEIQKYT